MWRSVMQRCGALGLAAAALVIVAAASCEKPAPKVQTVTVLTAANVTDPRTLEGTPVQATGTARNGQGAGAVVDLGGGVIVFVENITGWPEGRAGKKVEVTGIATIVTLNLDAAGDGKPAFAPTGNRWIVISNADIVWK